MGNTSANTLHIQHEVFGSRRCFCCQLCPGSCNPPQRCCCLLTPWRFKPPELLTSVMQSTHMPLELIHMEARLLMPMELLSLLIPLKSMLPRLPMLLPEVLSSQLVLLDTHMPMPDLLLPPTVLLSQLNPLMLSRLVLTISLPTAPKFLMNTRQRTQSRTK